MLNELEAAEALEKFALDLSDVMSTVNDGVQRVGQGIGGAASYVGEQAGHAAGAARDGWKGLPPEARSSLAGAAGGAAIATIIEGLRDKKKKNYMTKAMLGGSLGAILPHVDIDTVAGPVVKVAETSAIQNYLSQGLSQLKERAGSSLDGIAKSVGEAAQPTLDRINAGAAGATKTDWSSMLSNPTLQAAAPALIGGAGGAIGGALMGRKKRKLQSALMGGLAGAGLGMAYSPLRDLAKQYTEQKTRDTSDLSGPNKDTTLNHLGSADGEAGKAVGGNPIARSMGAGAVGGTAYQFIKDRLNAKRPASSRDVLDMFRNKDGVNRDALAGHIEKTMSGRFGQLDPTSGDDAGKLQKVIDSEIKNTSHAAAHAIPDTKPKHSWQGWLNSLRGSNAMRDAETRNSITKPVTQAVDSLGTNMAADRPDLTKHTMNTLQINAMDHRNAKLQNAPLRSKSMRYLKGGTGKGAAIGTLLGMAPDIIPSMSQAAGYAGDALNGLTSMQNSLAYPPIGSPQADSAAGVYSSRR